MANAPFGHKGLKTMVLKKGHVVFDPENLTSLQRTTDFCVSARGTLRAFWFHIFGRLARTMRPNPAKLVPNQRLCGTCPLGKGGVA